MKRQIATLLTTFFWIQTSLFAYNLDLNISYDHFRGLPDGSWNGNNGTFVAGNFEIDLIENLDLQIGGSYGVYNWNGKENLVFKSPNKQLQQAFVTAGLATSFQEFNLGVVYDGLFTRHFGIYNLSPYIDQLRFQAGYQFCQEEIGIWGTAGLHTAHKTALGIPVSFKAINQINLFWSHFFDNSAMTTLWIGLPYRKGLMPQHKIPGTAIAGFAVHVPLTDRLYIDGHGAYMGAKKFSGSPRSRNYDANVCIGITYLFGENCINYRTTYQPIANNSNFFIDTNMNQ